MKHTHSPYKNGVCRSIPPQETLSNIKEHLQRVGISRVANITGLDRIGIPVYMACRPNSRSLSVSQGKGITEDAAKISALMESIEGFHAERIHLPTRILSYEDLTETCRAVDTKKLTKLKSSHFDKKTKIPWVQGVDLFTKKDVWVPFECVHTDYTFPKPLDHGHFIADSNGLASGNTLTEATNHALYEVIERDALALWSLKPEEEKRLKKVKLNSLQSDFFKALLDKIKRAHAGIGIWDLTSDIGIPTFLCKIMDLTNVPENRTRPAHGSGTHCSKEVALLRAVTEAAQSRLTFIAGARDDQYQSIYRSQSSDEVYNKWHKQIVEAEEFLEFRKINDIESRSLEDDQKVILKRLALSDCNEVVCVNLTRENIGIPVVKVIVPCLEGISFPGERVLGERGRATFVKSGVGACVEIL